MTRQELLLRRLSGLFPGQEKALSIPQLLHQMGAMQAQDLRMVKLAIGIRTTVLQDRQVETAINQGEIIRTHLLRPTWHMVARDDLRWMLRLTAPRIKASMRSRHRQLEITDETVKQSNNSLEKALTQNQALDRHSLIEHLQNANISEANNRGYHLLLRAELDGLICSGPIRDGKHTYVLLDDRIPASPELSEEEAAVRLAQMYFGSHGPARLKDFIWWSGLTARLAKKALTAIQKDLLSTELSDETYWFSEDISAASPSLLLLPAYDEYLIGYHDKSIPIADEAFRKRVHSNGVFRPIVVVNGSIVGIWKLDRSRKKIRLQLQLFSPSTVLEEDKLTNQVNILETFWGEAFDLQIDRLTK
ncbi:MAG: winged helix DNA-binding domain-containing protein [Bacteroidota bacterium]